MDSNGNSTAYEYDTLDRQTTTTFADNSTRQSSYNPASNLTGYTDENGTAFSYTYDALNRRTAVTIDSLGDGVLSATGTVQTFEYDGLSRVTKATDTSANLGGDPGDNDLVTDFLHLGQQVVEEQDNDSTVLRQYVWGDYIDELIQQREYNPYKPDKYHDHYLLTDIHYRSIALANEDGCLCEGYDTDAYGVTQIFDDITGACRKQYPMCAYIFTGRYYDAETARISSDEDNPRRTGLYYYRARHYSPDLGRFISRDPKGYADGMGMYQYVGGRPLLDFDPTGNAAVGTSDEHDCFDWFFVWPREFISPNFVVRKEYPAIAQEAFKRGLPAIPESHTTIGETALGEMPRSAYPASTTWLGAPKFCGTRLHIDIDTYLASGGRIFTQDDIIKSMRSSGIPPERIARYRLGQINNVEGEVLLTGPIPAEAIQSSATRILVRGSQGVMVLGTALSAYRIGRAIDESNFRGSGLPLANQVVKEGAGWVGAWIGGVGSGFLYGIAVGSETGPGAVITGIIGACVGGFVAASAVESVQQSQISRFLTPHWHQASQYNPHGRNRPGYYNFGTFSSPHLRYVYPDGSIRCY